MSLEVTCVLPLPCALGEGPMWSAKGRCLWFVDIEGRHVHRFDPASSRSEAFETPGRPGFVLPTEGESLVVGMEDALWLTDGRLATWHRLATVPLPHPRHRINDGHADAAGRLWFGTLNEDETEASGRLMRFHAGALDVADGEGCVITNGPATSPDGRTLYHSDTLNGLVHAYHVADDGSLRGKRIFTSIPAAEGYTDGITVDSGGRVWVALFGGWGVRCYDRRGSLVRRVAVPAANVTKIAFGGRDLKTVYVTTARKGLDEAALRQQPLAGSVFSFRTDVPGQAQHEVKL